MNLGTILNGLAVVGIAGLIGVCWRLSMCVAEVRGELRAVGQRLANVETALAALQRRMMVG